MVKLLNWFNKQVAWFKKNEFGFLQFLILFYIFFIPIWPKLPVKTIEYTYIAIRWEDLFMVFFSLVFFIQLIFKKISLRKNPLLVMIILYWVVVFVSYLLGFYYFRTVKTLELGFLNAARRVEYMIVFGIAFAALKNRNQFWFFLKSILFVVFIVAAYGIGQKFLGWPAVQTMNPHYSKGYLLVLDANARISSTFGGHYDFAAYLIFFIPLVLSFFVYTKKKWYFLVFSIMVLSLVLTASRVTYVTYFASVIPFLLFVKKPKLLIAAIILILLFTPLSENLTKRINRTFRQEKIWYNPITGNTVLPRDMSPNDLPAGDYLIGQRIPTPQAVGVVTADQTTRTTNEIKKQLNITDDDVFKIKKQIREQIADEARKSGKVLPEEEVSKIVDATFVNLRPVQAILPDISIATRLQVEWPRAYKAFLMNPLTGLGPSSITEATDNDFLRALGETGILGFSLLYGIIIRIAWIVFQRARTIEKEEKIVLMGMVFGTWALLVNALMIDVLEASKIALTVWLVWGLFIKYSQFRKAKAT